MHKERGMRMFVLAMQMAGALLAQDITGTWQGTLQAGRELRTVIKISRGDGGALLYSIDQGGQGLPSGPIALQGTTVKMPFPGIGGEYEVERRPKFDFRNMDAMADAAAFKSDQRDAGDRLDHSGAAAEAEADGSGWRRARSQAHEE